MGRDKRSSVEYTVRLNKICQSDLKKIRKHNSNLLKEVTCNLEQLKLNPDLGERLRENLAGFYSIHLPKYKFRIVYHKHDASHTIVVVTVRHRSSVYSDFAKYMDLL